MILNKLSYITILFLMVFTACGNRDTTENAPEEHHEEEGTVAFTDAQFKMANIQFGKVEKRKITGTIKANGLLDVPPQQLISISVPYGGILKNTDLLQGMWVKRGQVIATLEHPDYIQLQLDYLDAKSQLGFLEKEYQRQQELSRENVSAAKTFQRTEADYRSIKSKVQGLAQKLSILNISAKKIEEQGIARTVYLTSPIDGYVTEVNVNIGKFVNANDVLFEIVDTRHLHAELTLFERDIPRLKIGDKVRFMLANETKERMATLYLIGREISPERTIRVHCHLDEEDKELLPGMYLKAWIESSGGTETNVLPDKAIVQFGAKKYIFVRSEEADHHHEEGEHKHEEKEGEHTGEEEHHGKEAHAFRMVEVQTGVSEDGYTEVILPEGFDGETPVVVNGVYDLLSKMQNSEEEGHAH